jgi:hypothetical protein
LQERKLYEFLLWLGTFFPRLVPWINKLYCRILFSKRRETIDRSDKYGAFVGRRLKPSTNRCMVV